MCCDKNHQTRYSVCEILISNHKFYYILISHYGLSLASPARAVFNPESSSDFGSGSASKVLIAPMSEKLKTKLSYVYSAILVMSGTASSKASGRRG